jgi:hypothetical protein
MQRSLVLVVALAACAAPTPDAEGGGATPADSMRRAFADTVAALVMDDRLLELRGHLFVKAPNPNRDDEAPLVDREVDHPPSPGPHTMDGKLYAELGVLRALLGDGLPVRTDTARGHVFVGAPPVLLVSHMHGRFIYVPVKLFARQYGAYTDVGCTIANCGHVWPRDVIEFMRRQGATGGAGIIEGHAEGIVRNVDVTRLPSGN